MRKLGFALLVGGFVWLCIAAYYYDMTMLRVSSRTRDELVGKDTFTRDEVTQQISAIFRQLPERAPWLVAPGVVMFVGGLALGLTRRREKSLEAFAGTTGSRESSTATDFPGKATPTKPPEPK